MAYCIALFICYTATSDFSTVTCVMRGR